MPRLVGQVCGLQAQDPQAALLGARARAAGLTAAEVERARVEDRSVVVTWCWRGTLHLVATEDLSWILPLVGPVFVRASSRRYAALGLDE
ncbi:MAG: winged helix DNA-binding domain-containing protein, partial [Chloroflexota bacterium]|nr:winged helix DNA-binding domain-containing protein [Chloroflexota bacterium]